MKKLVFGLMAGALLMAACSEKEKETAENTEECEKCAKVLRIDHKMIKGTLDLPQDTKVQPGTYSHNGVSSSYVAITLDGGSLIVGEEFEPFDTIVAKLESGSYGLINDVTILEKESDVVLFSTMDKPEGAEEEQEGYGFYLRVKGPSANMLLYCEGEKPFEPVWDRTDLNKMLQAARTFSPE
jgi:hypothetical protein